ncbi:MAG: M13 family metallopeptidase [Acidobacteriia bacterium]|nr:M13 family metallopeptidase [Terriglobia bacterium]
MNYRPLLALFALPVLALAADSASGLDTAAMNKSVDPCVDFHQYACGNWIAHNPVPADRARWGRFTELNDRNEKVLLDIIQGAAVERPGRSALDQKIGDFFTSCMDTAAINKKGLAPLQPELDRINAMSNREEVLVELVRLHRRGVGVLFSFGAQPDAKDSTRTIASLGQGGLSLPDRDYYLKTDPKSVETRQRYVEHMKKMFRLAGDSPENAAAKAQTVLDFETTIAKASADRVSMRDPNKRYHILSKQELQALAPWDWEGYFKGVGAPAFETLNVSGPDFIKQIAATLPTDTVNPWQAYFTWHLLRQAAAQLPEAFENESFDFWQRYLTGAKEPRPRSARCVAVVDRSLGDLLGQKYIEVAFGPDAKAQIGQLVDALDKALGKDIQGLPWMTDTTKKAALDKLKAITNNVGYPKKWRDYSKVTVARDDLFGNSLRAAEAIQQDRLQRIGKPTDKTEWSMTTPTVNAFYSPQNNSINFPAGILQSPFFDPRRDIALNYGAAGMVIGHEMTHGFDDQGRKFDGDGNLRDWWTPKDGAEFEKRVACVADEYSGFTAVDDVKLNGRLTLGENTADNGGLRVALMALQDTLKGKESLLDGFTPEQRFFLGFAQIWCENSTPQSERQQALTNPHSPGRYRVDGTLQNMPEFQKAFSCKAGQPMVSSNACRVW